MIFRAFPIHNLHLPSIPQRRALLMVSKRYQNDDKNDRVPSDGRSKWIREVGRTTAETNHSPAMGAQNGFDKLPKRSPRCTIPQRWVLKVDSKTYANDRKNEPLPSDGRSKWLRQVTKTMPKMSHSPATGAQNGFKLSQKRTIPQQWALLSPPSSPPRLRTSPSLFFLPPAPLLSELWC